MSLEDYHSANFPCVFILDGAYGVSNLSAWTVFYSFKQHNIKSVWFHLHFRTTLFKDRVSTKHFNLHDFRLKSLFKKKKKICIRNHISLASRTVPGRQRPLCAEKDLYVQIILVFVSGTTAFQIPILKSQLEVHLFWFSSKLNIHGFQVTTK